MPKKYVVFLMMPMCGHCVNWNARYQRLDASQKAMFDVRNGPPHENPEGYKFNAVPAAFDAESGASVDAHELLEKASGSTGTRSKFRADKIPKFISDAAEDKWVRRGVALLAAVWVLRRLGF